MRWKEREERYAEEVGKSVGSVKKCSYNHDDDYNDDEGVVEEEDEEMSWW